MLTIRDAQLQAMTHSTPAVLPCPLTDACIELELVGEDGAPIAGAAYRVVLPDGRVIEGALDRRGTARVEAIPRGVCSVSFPELDRDAWERIDARPLR